LISPTRIGYLYGMNSRPSTPLVLRPAFTFAREWHRGQIRKGGKEEDFIQHPLRVAERLWDEGLRKDTLLDAALLHDVLEDTDCPPDSIVEQFGVNVLAIVREVTDDKSLLKSERKQRQVERAEYLTAEAGLIRLADKIDNVASLLHDPPSNWNWPRQRAYVAWSARVVHRIPDPHPALLAVFHDLHAKAWRIATGRDERV